MIPAFGPDYFESKGIVRPVDSTRPEPYRPEYPGIQIQDELDRNNTRIVLLKLWNVMGLQKSGHIIPVIGQEERRELFRYFSNVVLGENIEGEVEC